MRYDPSDYDEDKALTEYIWRHYRQLMKEVEKRTDSAVLMREKVRHSAHPRMVELLREYETPEVLQELSVGDEEFRQRAAKRLLAERKDEIFVNRCPECRRVVVSPNAKQCLWCHHHWHDSV